MSITGGFQGLGLRYCWLWACWDLPVRYEKPPAQERKQHSYRLMDWFLGRQAMVWLDSLFICVCIWLVGLLILAPTLWRTFWRSGHRENFASDPLVSFGENEFHDGKWRHPSASGWPLPKLLVPTLCLMIQCLCQLWPQALLAAWRGRSLLSW
jgi:hypothetical protein